MGIATLDRKWTILHSEEALGSDSYKSPFFGSATMSGDANGGGRTIGYLEKPCFRRNTSLLTKNFSLHIKYMLRLNLSFAPSLA